ncbi:DUF397 domain-containing protein [Streptomyces sp. SP18CS02]|uniref:DUF397 domain-containing protein n=1 Tax=Streptomyces sp. SP18CS02 TaxID=3002531 RepID=UPI002E793EFD|nr:DUF397 domain-containing protein [Streptomyces sp. SP18CS02]MEE1752324.1 DUF397 domain-containing protein [Streptomyces sp. SP18CS02]
MSEARSVPLPTTRWFKSSYSGANTTECVECARVDDDLLVRDSKLDAGPVVAVSGAAWRRFVAAVGTS